MRRYMSMLENAVEEGRCMKIAIVGFDFPDCALEEGLCRKEGIAIQRFDGKSPEYILEHVHDVDGVILSLIHI